MMQLRVTKQDLLFMAERHIGISDSASAERLWDGLMDLRKDDLLSTKQEAGAANKFSCKTAAICTGVAIAGLGLLSGAVLASTMGSTPLIGLFFAIAFVAMFEILGWALLVKMKLKVWAAVCFCVSCLVGFPAVAMLLLATFAALRDIYFQVWGFVLLVVAPSVAHFYFDTGVERSTRPVLSVPLYLHSYVFVGILLVSFAPIGGNLLLGVVPFVVLACACIAWGVFCESRLHLEKYANVAHAAGLIGLLPSLVAVAVLTRYSMFWVALGYVPLALALAACGWLVGRFIYHIGAGIVVLMWLSFLGSFLPWMSIPFYVIPVVFVAFGALVVGAALVFAKNYQKIESFLHASLPSWMFSASARRRVEYQDLDVQPVNVTTDVELL